MKNKKLNLVIASILLVGIIAGGIVNAQDSESEPVYIGEIVSDSGINISDFTAGTETQAEFSFEYSDNVNAAEHFPLIYELNFENSSSEIPEVWKNDFEVLEGTVAREVFGYEFREITLECSNEFPLTVDHQIGPETIESAENGTFYCYNTTEGTWDNLKKHNKVSLDITSHPALVPGEYNITAKMFYLNDTYAPEVEILNKSYFDQYFTSTGEESIVIFYSNINEANLEEYWGKILTSQGNRSFDKEWVEEDKYKFYDLPDSIEEGNYELKVIAQDVNGYRGIDNTTIKIDNTAPEIELIKPTGEEIFSETMLIKAEVVDEKAGVNSESVKYRLREMNGTNICPESGAGTWDCYNSGWLSLEESESEGIFEKEVNTDEINLASGEYWLDIKAKDTLGNERNWDGE